MTEAEEVTPPPSSTQNIAVIAGLIVFMLVLYVCVSGYQWVVQDIIIKNTYFRNQIERRQEQGNMPEVTLDQKRLLKVSNYWYTKYIRSHTPMNAVILLPPYKAIKDNQEMGQINNADWVEYFIYPRLCISEDDKLTKPELYAKADYVAIVDSWGYDKLKYHTTDTSSINILPINKPIRRTQSTTTNYESK